MESRELNISLVLITETWLAITYWLLIMGQQQC